MRFPLIILVVLAGFITQEAPLEAAELAAMPKLTTSQSAIVQPAPKIPQPDLSAIGEDIQDWQARLELARLLSYVKRYDESLEQYRKVIKEKPALKEAYIEMASVMSWTGRTDEALALLRNISQQGLKKNERLALADIFIDGKDYPAAEALLLEELQFSPEDDRTRLKLAEILSWTKRYDDSLKEYSILLRNRPDDVQIRRKYAFVLIWSGKREQAVQELRKSLKE